MWPLCTQGLEVSRLWEVFIFFLQGDLSIWHLGREGFPRLPVYRSRLVVRRLRGEERSQGSWPPLSGPHALGFADAPSLLTSLSHGSGRWSLESPLLWSTDIQADLDSRRMCVATPCPPSVQSGAPLDPRGRGICRPPPPACPCVSSSSSQYLFLFQNIQPPFCTV